jgi:hypothetical protein
MFGVLAAAAADEPANGQSPLFPIGRPFTMASGFSGPVQNVPIDTRSSVIPVPGQSTGFFLPNFRKLMLFPNRNIVPGISPVPAPSAFQGATFSNALNPFKPVTKK